MSAVRIVTADELRKAVQFSDLIEPMANAFRASSNGEAENGLITMFPADERTAGDVYVKTATLRSCPVFVVKVSPWFAANVANDLPQGGLIAVFSSKTGHTLALLKDEHYLSDVRTAAAGSVVARILAPAAVTTALVVGSGVQAYWQPQALFRERPFRRLSIWARDLGKADALSARLAQVLPGLEIRVVSDLEAAVARADVILTTTPTREPLVFGRWLRAGQHITAIGADDETKCELDSEALRSARVFVDARATAAATGEVHRALSSGDYELQHLAAEIGEVLAGTTHGRVSDDEITLATLAGVGAQDLLAAEFALRALAIPIETG